MSDSSPILCCTCRTLPAGNDYAGAHSAYCRICQPRAASSAPASADLHSPAGDGEMTTDQALAVILRHIAS